MEGETAKLVVFVVYLKMRNEASTTIKHIFSIYCNQNDPTKQKNLLKKKQEKNTVPSKTQDKKDTRAEKLEKSSESSKTHKKEDSKNSFDKRKA